MSPFLALLCLAPSSPAEFLSTLRDSVAANQEAAVVGLFARSTDAHYLRRLARNHRGWSNLKVAMIPTPPGRTEGRYWAVFHAWQDLEQDHDAVYRVIDSAGGLRLGPEVPEHDDAAGLRVESADIEASLRPDLRSVQATVRLKIAGSTTQAPIFRLNDVYLLDQVAVGGRPAPIRVVGDQSVPSPLPGEVVRAGGLLIPWRVGNPRLMELTYAGRLERPHEDQVGNEVGYVTAGWVPTLSRLPFRTRTTVEAPGGWEVRSEGDLVDRTTQANGRVRWRYRCDLPISYPKVIAGRYSLVSSLMVDKKRYRAYQMGRVDPAKGDSIVKDAAAAVAWFEKTLGPFPFGGYDVFDSDRYYGIESYSHTLLHKDIVGRFTSHEIGHTYFGGLAPCAYVVDSWNEGVTTYVDGVLYQGDRGGDLKAALQTLDEDTPLNRMAAPHDYRGASYSRGAYVMRMLESEFGLDAVLAGLRVLVRDFRGHPLDWDSLRPVFEKATGADLRRFWREWIQSGRFPTVRIESAAPLGEGKARVIVRQDGVPSPRRVRFKIGDQTCVLDDWSGGFEVPASSEYRVDVFGMSLARTGPAVRP